MEQTEKDILGRLEHSLQTRKEAIAKQKSLIQPSPECKTCGGVGFVPHPKAISNSPQMTECECAIDRRVVNRLPELYRLASIADLRPRLLNEILEWLANPSLGLVVKGRPGRGKTYLACAITRALLQTREEVFFLRCYEFYLKLREAYKSDLSESEIFADFMRNKYLVLDDLGSGGFSDFERRSTCELLDRRANHGLITIVTTNCSVQDVADKMDERVASRLDAFHIIELGGPDRRSLA